MNNKESYKQEYIENVCHDIKDLGKQFLTLVSGILAFTVTFAEKIIKFAAATLPQTMLLMSSWALLVISISSVGVGLWQNYNSSINAMYNNVDKAWKITKSVYGLYLLGGFSFGIGLILLALPAISRLG